MPSATGSVGAVSASYSGPGLPVELEQSDGDHRVRRGTGTGGNTSSSAAGGDSSSSARSGAATGLTPTGPTSNGTRREPSTPVPRCRRHMAVRVRLRLRMICEVPRVGTSGAKFSAPVVPGAVPKDIREALNTCKQWVSRRARWISKTHHPARCRRPCPRPRLLRPLRRRRACRAEYVTEGVPPVGATQQMKRRAPCARERAGKHAAIRRPRHRPGCGPNHPTIDRRDATGRAATDRDRRPRRRSPRRRRSGRHH
jgi:hypothetical protein